MKDLSKYHYLIVEMNGNYEGVTAIAEVLGVHDGTVSRYCRKNGIEVKPKMFKGICKQCNKEYKAKRFNVKFCSDKCRMSFNSKGDKVICCNYCGTNILSAKYTKSKMCVKCREQRKEKRREKRRIESRLKRGQENIGISCDIAFVKCKCCGNQFITSNHNVSKVYCSEKCQQKIRRIKKRVYYNTKCIECGKHYTTHIKNKNFCSKECSKKYWNRERYNKRRLLMFNNGNYDPTISIERLIKRDGYKCYICGIETDRTLHSNHNDYPSIEHVIPLSKGGTHSWGNVKLACRGCNSKKSTKNIKEFSEAALAN